MIKIFLAFIIAFTSCFSFGSTKTIVKADIVEGIVSVQELIGAKGHFEKNANGWNGFDDGGSSSPTDGTGGTVTTTCTRSTSSPIDGDGSFLLTKSAANYQGEGCSLDFNIPANLSGTVLRGSFEYNIASGTYTDDAIQVWLYNVTDGALVQPAPTKIKKHSLNKQTFDFEFQPTYATSVKTWRVILHIAATDTNAYTIKIDNWKIGAYPKNYGSPVTDWNTSWTPTGNLSTNVTYYGKWRKVGDSMQIEGMISFSGANTQGVANITLPNSANLDTTKFSPVATGRAVFGSARIYDSSTDQSYDAVVTYDTATSIRFSRGDTTAGSATDTSSNRPITFASGDIIAFNAIVPILGWSSSVVMSNDADTRIVAAIITGDAASATSGNPLIIPTVGYDSHAGYNATTGRYTVYVPGLYRLYGSLQSASSATTLTIYKNAASTQLAGNLDSNGEATYTGLVTAVAGDILDIRPSGTVDPTNITLNIERVSGPVQVAASDSVGALYTGAPPTGTLTSAYNTTTFGTKRKDSHNAYSGGVYTVPVSGTYSIQAQARHDATYAAGNTAGIALFIDGVQFETGLENAGGVEVSIWPKLNVHSVPLLAGQLVTIRSFNNATTPTFGNLAVQNYFSIVRTGNY